MERRNAGVKIENTKNINLGSSFYTTSSPLRGSFEYSPSDHQVEDKIGGGNNSSLGFMELLGLHDYGNYNYNNSNNNNPSSILDMVQSPYTTVQLAGPPPPNTPPCTSSTIVPNTNNQPGTPISSASSEALNYESQAKGLGLGGDEDEEGGGGDGQEDNKKTKKGLRPKKNNQKKQKQHRVAFMTRSEVDHLEDGYRWRKYGQKAVKNSSFPRGYYRCTTASCNVKKRVERSFTDPGIVVTTYEGQHNHCGPVMVRPTFTGASVDRLYSTDGAFGMPMQTRAPLHHEQQHFLNPHSLGGFGYNASAENTRHLHERLRRTPQGSNLLPFPMCKEES